MYWDKWWRTRAPTVGVIVLVSAGFGIVSDMPLLWKASGIIFMISFATATSFIGVSKAITRPKWSDLASAVVERATGPLPPQGTIDVDRPLFAAGLDSNGKSQLYLVEFSESGPDSIRLTPISQNAQNVSASFYQTFAEFRVDVRTRHLGVAPQSDFTDKMAVELIGRDWRD